MEIEITKEATNQIIAFIAGACIGGFIVAWFWIIDNERNA